MRTRKKKALDVTDQKKMFSLGLFGMSVKEIADETNYGPFRVFKRIADQTNTSMAITSQKEQVQLCEYACLQAQKLGLVVNNEFHRERTKVAAKWKKDVYFS